MKIRKRVLFGLSLLVAGSVLADTFYLHANMVNPQDPLDKTLWFDAPTGGTDMATLGAPFAGNRFDVNGFSLRALNTQSSATFDGTIVAGVNGSGGVELLSRSWNVAGVEIHTNSAWRLRQSTVNLAVSSLELGASAALKFYTLTGLTNLNLSVADLSGSGSLVLGINSGDASGVWNVSITDSASAFDGTLDLQLGTLILGNDFALNAATFSINPAGNNHIVLENNVSFRTVQFGSSVLTEGTYTVPELNAGLGTDRFSGQGSLTVVLDPETFYLHANMVNPQDPLDKTLWFDAPTGGTDMATLGAAFVGNRFDVNGFSLRALNTQSLARFDGTLVVGANGSGGVELLSRSWNVAGVEIHTNSAWRLRQSTVNLAVSSLELGSSAALKFYTMTGLTNLNLSVADLSGSGSLVLGINSGDAFGGWKVSITERASDFSGALDLQLGTLTFGNNFALNAATFLMNSVGNNSVVLENSVSFSNMLFGANSLSNGIYTASDLNTMLATDRFSGAATLTVGPPSPAARYDDWLTQYPALGTSTNFMDDPDLDGMDNLLEYALRGSPTRSDANEILPRSSLESAGGTNWLHYIYTRRRDAVDRGLVYAVVSDADLVFGAMTNETEESGAAMIDAGFETVTNRISTAVEPHQFMNLKVEIIY